MKTISIKSRIGSDGILKLKVPTDIKEKNVQIVMVIQEESPSQNSWPEEFIKQTYGCLKKYRIGRPDQGEFEQREKFL